MGGKCSMYDGGAYKFLVGNVRERDSLELLSTDDRIILKQILNKGFGM
jgi:hypothetical protein